MSSDGAKADLRRRSRASIIAEMTCLAGLGLFAWLWIIPSQISGGGIGLDPRFLPRGCIAIIVALVLLDGGLRLLRGDRPPAYPSGWSALAITGGIAVLGVVVLMLAGASAASLAVVPLGMLALGERRPILIIAATAVISITLKLFQI